MNQQLGQDQVAQVRAVGIRPVFFIEQGIQQAQDDLVGFFLRDNQVFIFQVVTDGPQRLGKKNGKGRDKLRVQPDNNPLDIPRFTLKFRPVGFTRPHQQKRTRLQGVLVVFHMKNKAV